MYQTGSILVAHPITGHRKTTKSKTGNRHPHPLNEFDEDWNLGFMTKHNNYFVGFDDDEKSFQCG